ncbi:hypothetical protein GCM10007384_12430 [Aquimarina muelleri]|uniref:Uncharacterized protein n=1 Tax=Aquimarina muelleri TaxID=279356 RepID=A0A918N2F0_9FLAO|nr:hypothetical protein GCM10007384_12430 [Aquimarina muelleri]
MIIAQIVKLKKRSTDKIVESSVETSIKKLKLNRIITKINKDISPNSFDIVQVSFTVSGMINFGNISKIKIILEKVIKLKIRDKAILETVKDS